MFTLEPIYRRLAAIADRSVDRAMAAALPSADPQATALIVAALIARGTDEGRVALVRSYDKLSAPLRELLARQGEDLYRALASVAAERHTVGPANVIQIVRQARQPGLASLLTDLLRHGEPDLWAGAAEAILELSTWVAPHRGEDRAPCDGPAAAHLQEAIEEALSIYRHHSQAPVLLALLNLAPRAMPGTFAALADREHAALPQLRRLVADAAQPQVRRALLAVSRIPTLTTASLDGITRAAASHLDEVLGAAHLLMAGPIARAMARMPEPQRVLPTTLQDPAIAPPLAAALPAWIEALPLGAPQRLALWTLMAQSTHAAARLAALRRLIALDPAEQPQALESVAQFCSDEDALIARIALRHLIRTHWGGLTRKLLQLVNSPHSEVRTLAGDQLAPVGFQRFWDAWPQLNAGHQLAAGRALIKLSPNFHRLLGDRLTGHDRNATLRAMSIIYGLNQGSFFEVPLIALARSPDQTLAATAVRALGSGQSPDAVKALEAALQHADSRVRANAVESLEQLQSTRHVEQLLEMAQEDESRPRANAIGALMGMRARDALGALAHMLDDNRPRQRTSALWLVDQLGVVEVARHVAEMSISDPDGQVKTRASGVIQHLIQAMRDGAGEGHGSKAG